MKSICVFCGSSPGRNSLYKAQAQALGRLLVDQGITLVYGGGNVGLMGVIADTVLEVGGQAIGVMPEFLASKEIAHNGLTELYIVDSMHQRKAKMAELSDAFIAMPGGYGTLEEFFEILTWAQLGLHRKAFGLLNAEGYYDALLAFLDHAVSESFISPDMRTLVLDSPEPKALLELIRHYQPIRIPKWEKVEESLQENILESM